MDVVKLQEEIRKATEVKAEDELDRMIKLHEDEAAKRKEEIKRYLLALAVQPGKVPDYVINSTVASAVAVTEYAKHKQIAKDLRRLKAELA